METPDPYHVRLPDGREFGPADLELISQWAREGRIPMDAMLVRAADNSITPVTSVPAIQAILQAPPTISTGMRHPDIGPGPAMIPTRNPAALVGYYVSVFSLIPFLGILLGIVAVILGVIGMVKRSRNPDIRGLAHAWVAIILGTITTLVYSALLVAIIVGR